MDGQRELISRIDQLRRQRRAVILSHYYQRPEVQDIADFVGDSLELSRQAADTDAAVIVFCGVHFMAETAAILSPNKTVLLPEAAAGCPMADMVTAQALRERRRELPNHEVVAYVNTSAEVKAESDICCTSANAVRVVDSIPADKGILFVPDRNLGRYAALQTGRDVELWPGCCGLHDNLRPEDILAVRAAHPLAKVMAHPECRSEVLALADAVASTSGMLKYAGRVPAREFIVATEEGLLHQLRRRYPEKVFYAAAPRLVCDTMRMTTLEKVVRALETMEPQVQVPEEIAHRALRSLERMLAVS